MSCPWAGRWCPAGRRPAYRSVAASANALPAGVHPALLAFTNLSSGVAQSRPLALSVAAASMADAFDPGMRPDAVVEFRGRARQHGAGDQLRRECVVRTPYGSAPTAAGMQRRFRSTPPGAGRLASASGWPMARPGRGHGWTACPARAWCWKLDQRRGTDHPGSYDSTAYYDWTGIALPIPAVAQGPAVLFRWRQLSNDGANYDHRALDNVVIGTGSVPPRIVMDPQSQTVVQNDSATLTVAAIGTQPMNYQWLFDGASIPGATDASLAIASAQFTDAGTYRCSSQIASEQPLAPMRS